jgi:hypothetical protein
MVDDLLFNLLSATGGFGDGGFGDSVYGGGGSTSVASLTGGRIYPVILPSEVILPAIHYLFVGGSSDPTFTTSGTQKYRVEINCWASTWGAAKALRAAVIHTLNGYQDGNTTIQFLMNRDFYDHELLQFRAIAEFYILSTGI